MASKFYICPKCGHIHQRPSGSGANTASRGRRYLCPDCMAQGSYYDENNVFANSGKKSGNTLSAELEFQLGDLGEEGRNAMYATYGNIPTHDSTVYEEAKTRVYTNLRGIKQAARTWEQLVNLDDPSCGCHINVGNPEKLTEADIKLIRDFATAIYGPLALYLSENPDITAKVWGRVFGYWASASCGYREHRSWVNFEHNTHIEYRLAHFRTATQIFWAFCLCDELTSAVIKWFIEKGANQRAANHTGEVLVRIFKKYAEGRANCQRPERNNHRDVTKNCY